MNIIEAVWLERVLGVPSYEIEIQKLSLIDDSLATITKMLDENPQAYIIIKLNVGEPVVLNQLQAIGFHFVEMQISMKISANTFMPDSFMDGLFCNLERRTVDSVNHLDSVCHEVKLNMFTTDKIALDRRFGYKVANERYANWIRDVYNCKLGDIVELYEDNDPIGFVMVKVHGSRKVTGMLGGVYPRHKKRGYGASLIYENTMHYLNQGYEYYAGVSSNNPEIIKIYQHTGYKIDNMRYVLING